MIKEGDIRELPLYYTDSSSGTKRIKAKAIKIYDKGLYNMVLFESLKGKFKICENEVKDYVRENSERYRYISGKIHQNARG